MELGPHQIRRGSRREQRCRGRHSLRRPIWCRRPGEARPRSCQRSSAGQVPLRTPRPEALVQPLRRYTSRCPMSYRLPGTAGLRRRPSPRRNPRSQRSTPQPLARPAAASAARRPRRPPMFPSCLRPRSRCHSSLPGPTHRLAPPVRGLKKGCPSHCLRRSHSSRSPSHLRPSQGLPSRRSGAQADLGSTMGPLRPCPTQRQALQLGEPSPVAAACMPQTG